MTTRIDAVACTPWICQLKPTRSVKLLVGFGLPENECEEIFMKNPTIKFQGGVATRRTAWPLLASLALVVGLWGSAAPVKAADFSKETQACLTCHDKAGVQMKMTDGKTLSLQISSKAYAASVHSETECEDCHDSLDAKTHGKVASDVEGHRSFSMSMGEACNTCHKKKVTEYQDSVHAALVKEGSQKAPLCSDCHNPHTASSATMTTPLADTPCAKCHTAIFDAYSSDVHGKLRAANDDSAPVCSSCHRTHNIKAASFGDGIKDACLNCHKDSVAKHSNWLPNAGRHFEAISCPACHNPNAQRRVNLRLFDGSKQMSEKTGVPQFAQRTNAADAQHQGLNERALLSLLKEFNQADGSASKTVLRGRLEVLSGAQAHQISDKAQAIKDCNFCHKEGAEPFQSVTLTMAGPDGMPLRHGVQKEVLSSLQSISSVRGFYAIGSTRIKLLDILLVLVFFGALSVPIGHMTIKRLFKGMRERLEAERLAARANADTSAPPDEHSVKDDAKQ
jgi:predicted CXXCH cytochrome family protein